MKLMTRATIILLSFVGTAVAADQTWTGTISDKMCGASHKAMPTKLPDRECTQACSKKGMAYVLVSGNKIYQLTNHDADLRTHAGHVVKVTGELKADTIRVSKIDMSPQSR
jgi:hypothetical protein